MTDQILSAYKQRLGGLTLVPSDGGRFEVSIDGELVYSKLETGEFPPFETIKSEIDSRL